MPKVSFRIASASRESVSRRTDQQSADKSSVRPPLARALCLRRRWLLVAVVLFDADDAALREAVVGHAPSAHTGPSRPRSGIGGELPAPAHPRHDGVAAGDVVANLVRLPC